MIYLNFPLKKKRPKKKMIKEPLTKESGRQGKKIISERIKEDPGNTLAYH